MMQDGKALQAGTSHYLGTNFAEAAGIKFQGREGSQQFAHTTSWGTSTRMIGGVIMVHGDDDGLKVPPAIAPWQVVIVPMLREDEGDADLLTYCEGLRSKLAAQSTLGERLRVLIDKKPGKAAAKRWDWVRKGAPVVVEVGPRDMTEGKVSLLRRDALWAENGKPAFATPSLDEAAQTIPGMLADMQASLLANARTERDARVTRGVTSFAEVEAAFADRVKNPGWVEVQWSKPTGPALEAVTERLKALKLTLRNVPIDAAPADGACVFTGEQAVERVLVARAY
jgi:prolyl-tRNA synthetase